MKNFPAIAAVIALVLGVAWWQWHRTGIAPASAPAALAPATLAELASQTNARLPQPYGDGFVIRRVHIDGQRLVTDIVSADIALADIDPAKLPQIRGQEQQDLVAAACGDPTQLTFMHGGVTIVRRFLDKQGKPIFDIAVTDKYCGREVY